MSSQTISFIANRYEVTQQLATTALGVLVYARDWLTERQDQDDAPARVILIAVEPSLSAIPEFDAVLHRVLEKFKQPNSALKVIDLRVEHDIYWLVLDEADGKPFNTYCHPAGTTPAASDVQVCLNHILKAAKAIAPSGGFGFLEPSVIWYSSDNHFKLLNAPLAITANVLSLAQQKKVTTTATLRFHSAYISPQVAQGLPATPQDDTFSIAAIAYQFLAQQPAFGALDTLQVYEQQANPPPLTHIKADTWEVLKRALSLQRHLRQPSPYELLHAFTVIPSDAPTKTSTPASATFKPVFAGLAAILIVSVGVYFMFSTSSEQRQNSTTQQITTPSLPTVADEKFTPVSPPANTTPREETAEITRKPVQASHSQRLEKAVIATSAPVQNGKTAVQRTNQPVVSINRSVVTTPPRRNDDTPLTTQITTNATDRNPQQTQAAPQSTTGSASQQAPMPIVNRPALQAPPPRVAVSPPPVTTVQPPVPAPPPAPRAIVVQQDATTFIVTAPPAQKSPAPSNSPVRQVKQTGENTFIVQQ